MSVGPGPAAGAKGSMSGCIACTVFARCSQGVCLGPSIFKTWAKPTTCSALIGNQGRDSKHEGVGTDWVGSGAVVYCHTEHPHRFGQLVQWYRTLAVVQPHTITNTWLVAMGRRETRRHPLVIPLWIWMTFRASADVSVFKPDVGEVWTKGSQVAVQWSGGPGGTSVTLKLVQGEASNLQPVSTVCTVDGAAGSCSYIVPQVTTNRNYAIQAQIGPDYNNWKYSSYFSITGAGEALPPPTGCPNFGGYKCTAPLYCCSNVPTPIRRHAHVGSERVLRKYRRVLHQQMCARVQHRSEQVPARCRRLLREMRLGE